MYTKAPPCEINLTTDELLFMCTKNTYVIIIISRPTKIIILFFALSVLLKNSQLLLY